MNYIQKSQSNLQGERCYETVFTELLSPMEIKANYNRINGLFWDMFKKQ